MRTLNDYYVMTGTWANIGTANQEGDEPAAIFDAGYIHSVVIAISGAAIAGATLVTIFKNGTTTSSTVTLPDLMAANTGLELTPTTRVEVAPGDKIALRSDGNTSTSPVGVSGIVIRR